MPNCIGVSRKFHPKPACFFIAFDILRTVPKEAGTGGVLKKGVLKNFADFTGKHV